MADRPHGAAQAGRAGHGRASSAPSTVSSTPSPAFPASKRSASSPKSRSRAALTAAPSGAPDAPGAAGLTPPTDPRDRWSADLSIVTPGYFSALGVPFLRGRNFADSDRWTDDQLTRRRCRRAGSRDRQQRVRLALFAGAGSGRAHARPVRRSDVRMARGRSSASSADVRGHAVSEAPVPMVYVPHAQHPDVFLPSLIVRSSLPSSAVAAAIRDRITAYDPHLLVQRIRPMDEVISGALSRPRFNLLLVGTFAVLGLLLAAVGIYGVVVVPGDPAHPRDRHPHRARREDRRMSCGWWSARGWRRLSRAARRA